MKSSSEVEIKKIYEKSIRLLNDKQARLMDMRQVLKKAVIRLSLTARTDNIKINEILKDITNSVDENVDIDVLNKHLDTLFVLVNHSIDVNEESGETKNVVVQDTGVNISQVLNEIISQLTLPSSTTKNKQDITKSLGNSVDRDDFTNIANSIVSLVNCSIGEIEHEKDGLQDFITKISTQLADIESFTQLMHENADEVKVRSQLLTQSVETGVADIEETVNHSTDLKDLKEHVSQNLQGIRDHVNEFRIVEEQKENNLSDRYTQVIAELEQSQKETISLKNQLNESKIQLLRDPLTGIANRLAYEERVVVEVSRWKRTKAPLCMAIWDIDFFKVINDTYGHSAGDRVLKLFSEVIKNRIRDVDLFARIGGEEFVLLMPDTPINAALTLNNKLRVLLEECKFHYDGKSCNITSSVGISEFIGEDDPASVMVKADKALYMSKNGGRNMCTVFDVNHAES